MKRNNNEPFEDYKLRRAKDKKEQADYLRGFAKGRETSPNIWEPRKDIARVNKPLA